MMLQRQNGRELDHYRRAEIITFDGDDPPPPTYVTWQEYAMAQERAAREYRQWAENWSAVALMLAIGILFSIVLAVILIAGAPYIEAWLLR